MVITRCLRVSASPVGAEYSNSAYMSRFMTGPSPRPPRRASVYAVDLDLSESAHLAANPRTESFTIGVACMERRVDLRTDTGIAPGQDGCPFGGALGTQQSRQLLVRGDKSDRILRRRQVARQQIVQGDVLAHRRVISRTRLPLERRCSRGIHARWTRRASAECRRSSVFGESLHGAIDLPPSSRTASRIAGTRALGSPFLCSLRGL